MTALGSRVLALAIAVILGQYSSEPLAPGTYRVVFTHMGSSPTWP